MIKKVCRKVTKKIDKIIKIFWLIFRPTFCVNYKYTALLVVKSSKNLFSQSHTYSGSIIYQIKQKS